MGSKQELKVYLFEATQDNVNEDGSKAEGRETFYKRYAFEGDPAPYVDYGKYWDYGCDGYVQLVAKDGSDIDSDLECTVEWLHDNGFRNIDIRGMAYSLDAAGKWAEVRNGDSRDSALRVTRLEKMPEIDPKATSLHSELSARQENCIKIGGVPIFPEGGTVSANDPRLETLVLRPNLREELGKVWEQAIHAKAGVQVKVEVLDVRADRPMCKLKVTAETRPILNTALNAAGVLDPSEIEPDVVRGNADGPLAYVATVTLAAEVD